MLHQQHEPVEPSACFSAPYPLKDCSLFVYDRKLHLQVKLEMTIYNISRYICIHFAGILKSATMNRRLFGHYAATWYAVARELR